MGIITGVFSIIIISMPSSGQDKAEKQENIVSASGRLVLESQEEGERLMLYGKDRKVYIVHGDFRGVLKSLLSDLGEDNLVSVEGILWEGYDISSKIKYGFGPQGEKTLDTQCIRYYHLKVTQIKDAKKSKEKMLPPERDVEEEARLKKSTLARIYQESSVVRAIRNIQGKISSLNLRAPIKTIEISSRDRNKVLLISSETRIAKKAQETEEPMFLSFDSLRVNQEVYVEYLEDEYKPEALFITITKE
jgi:hypothetical protein